MASETRIPKLLTIREICEATGVKAWRFYELVAQGEVPVMRIGRTIRVAEDVLVRWIQQRHQS